ncbi:hypothetical protein PVAND_008506 [Polypedilum vanderplanki]|uniref:Uncharacterized protein n=1 Tax=Polypedilum vanderplanki TaxID=319348 RepID=A0A9J6CB95_POLVA|nr:hypothetical protein PVAND_008506 [Polypedilum vanderplanki]
MLTKKKLSILINGYRQHWGRSVILTEAVFFATECGEGFKKTINGKCEAVNKIADFEYYSDLSETYITESQKKEDLIIKENSLPKANSRQPDNSDLENLITQNNIDNKLISNVDENSSNVLETDLTESINKKVTSIPEILLAEFNFNINPNKDNKTDITMLTSNKTSVETFDVIDSIRKLKEDQKLIEATSNKSFDLVLDKQTSGLQEIQETTSNFNITSGASSLSTFLFLLLFIFTIHSILN